MSVSVNISNKKTFPIQNSEEPTLDFTYNQFSPNPTFVSSFLAQFVCTPSFDPISFIKNEMSINGVSQNLEAALNVDDIITIPGQLNLSSPENSFIFGQGQKSQFDIKFEPYPNTFFDKSEKLSLLRFSKQKDWTEVSYVTERNSVLEDFILLVVTTQTLIEAARAVYNLFEVAKEAISSGFDSLSAAVKTILKLAMNVIYTAAILVALNELLRQASEILFDKPKKLNAVDVWKTFEDGCSYLGYKFESSLRDIYKDLVFVANTTTGGRTFGNAINIPTPNYSFLQFIENIGALFNAKLKVLEDRVIFETVTFYEDNPNTDIKLLNLYNNGKSSFNFSDLPETIVLKYAKVSGDNNYKTHSYTETYGLKNGNNKTFGAKSSIDVNLAFAKGEYKDEESTPEIIFNSIFDLLTGLSKGYKTPTGSRIGFWKLEQNIVPQDTVFIKLSDGRMSEKTNTLLKPEPLFNEFYTNESPINNQFTIVRERGAQPICGVDTNVLIENNVIRDYEGRSIIVTKNLRKSQDGLYDIEYRRRMQESDFGFVGSDLIEVTKTTVEG